MFGKCLGGGRRAAERANGSLTVVVTTVTKSVTVQLADLSTTGARLRGDYLPDKYEELMLSIGTLKAFGTVAWSSGDECGVSFDLPLCYEAVDGVRKEVAGRRGLSLEMKSALDAWTVGSVW
jgi:translation initiation factor 2 gamma subunit (eIF-2gamma)